MFTYAWFMYTVLKFIIIIIVIIIIILWHLDWISSIH
jgi:hypothetical protein